MSDPVDPTTTSAWAELTELKASLEPDLRGWFAADPGRVDDLSFTAGDLHVDLSKNLINGGVLAALVRLAEQVDLPGRRAAMFAGQHINVTENRAVLHTALRRPRGDVLEVDGAEVVAEVHDVLTRVYAFADSVRKRGLDRGHRGTHRDRREHRDRRLRPRPGDGVRGAEALREARARGPVRLQHRPDRRIREDSRPEPGHHLVHRCVQDVHHAGDPDQRPVGALLAAVRAALRRGDPGGRGRGPGRRRQALRGRLDRAGQGRRVRHRPGERLRLLGLGGRPLLGRLGDRHQRCGGDRAGELRRLPGRLPCWSTSTSSRLRWPRTSRR